MATDGSLTDFSLPGDSLLPRHMERIAAAFSFCYSFKFNIRRLESHFYSAWNYILLSLTADDPTLFLCPQLLHFYERSDSDADAVTSSSASISSRAISNADAVIPDFSIGRFLSEPRTQRLVSPGSGTATPRSSTPRPAQPSKTPTPSSQQEPWYALKTVSARMLAIFELKRPAIRSASSPEAFLEELEEVMDKAIKQLHKQLYIVFNSDTYDVSDSLLCVAACGEWYCWMIAERKEYTVPAAPKRGWHTSSAAKMFKDETHPDRAEEELVAESLMFNTTSDSEEEKEDQTSTGGDDLPLDLDLMNLQDQPDPLEIYGPESGIEASVDGSFPRFVTELLNSERFASSVQRPVKEGLATKYRKWSKYILFGSPASNQAMYYMHRFLKDAGTANPQ
ncbi:hypothetical protein D9613_004590 [Agrocybe pediades]|uniref:Uncharacterized protein n=1 Tax=Agrocybe pediades TaxID=84607 RepID=A0A8H4QK76_9AGAR|nr:hypothetical protein D9613_004590 [Agrocybe pediades]